VLVASVSSRPWPSGTTVKVLSVVADADVSADIWRQFGYGKNAVAREMERRGDQLTALAVEPLGKIGIPAEVVVSRGDARHLVPFFARKWSTDLILVRAHVRKDFTHWMLGSVARAVVTIAPCSVEIVRDTADDDSKKLENVRKILVATDGSEISQVAARAVAERPWPEGSVFKVVSVEEPWTSKRSRAGSSEEAQVSVTSAEQILASAGFQTTGEVLSGDVKKTVLEEAQKWAADLIVVGSHGRKGFKRMLLGSVSEAVAMNAHCSVLVGRGAQRSSRTASARTGT
jgi:nucleotide-binding universal stress UspA family protein